MFPRWLTWLFMGMMVYLVYMAIENPKPATQEAPVSIPPITEQTYPTLAKTADRERWKRALNPDYAAKYHCVAPASGDGLGLKITDEAIGSGDKARCSDHVRVQLTVWDAAGKKLYVGEVPVEIGIGAIAAGLDMGLVGMRVGGSRTLVIPASLMTRHPLSEKPVEKLPTALLRALPLGKLAVITATRVQ